MCLFRFVAFCVSFNDFCFGPFSRIHLGVTNQSAQTFPNESAFPLRSCFCSWLTSNWEVSPGRSWYIFVDFAQSQLQFFMISYIEDNETNLLTGKRTLCVLYDSLKRLSAKLFVESLFNRLFRVVAFRFTFDFFCCIRQRCGQLLRIVLRITDQSWHVGQKRQNPEKHVKNGWESLFVTKQEIQEIWPRFLFFETISSDQIHSKTLQFRWKLLRNHQHGLTAQKI